MGFQCGIVGLPNVGKSTLFNALTRMAAEAQNYPFCTIEPNVGRVPVPDHRLSVIQSCFSSEKVIPSYMDFIDIAGLVKGASRGEGLGNQFLGHIRSVQAIAHVVRCFEDDDVIHVEGKCDPVRDAELIETELIYADFETIEKSLEKNKRNAKYSGFLKQVLEHLQGLKPLYSFVPDSSVTEEQTLFLKTLCCITEKPMMYVANASESDLTALSENKKPSALLQSFLDFAHKQNRIVVVVSAKIEHELSQLEPDEAREYLDALGLKVSGLDRVIQAGYGLLGLMTYFTAGPKETRAWTIPFHTKAPQAAGVIHTDFEQGFICAEVYHYRDLEELKDEAKLRSVGRIRKEGKEYVCQDGDVMHFLFNVSKR